MSRTGLQPSQALAGYEALDREARARGWATIEDLLGDAPVVDVEAARRVPTLACAACGRLDAPRVAVGAGLDLHECRCGAYTARWHCCGRVALSPAPTATYRADAVCPNLECRADRFGTPAPYRPLPPGMHNPDGERVEAEIAASARRYRERDARARGRLAAHAPPWRLSPATKRPALPVNGKRNEG